MLENRVYSIDPLVPGQIGQDSTGDFTVWPAVPVTFEALLDYWPSDDIVQISGLPIVTD